MNGAVFITGASAGFGKACAARFAGDGRPLILAARRAERLEGIRKALADKAAVHPLVLDVRDREAVERAVAQLPEPFDEVDILINNAGAALGIGPAHEADPQDWEVMIDTNIKGVVHCTRSLLPQMVSRNRGHIVNLGSVAGDWPYPGGNVYGATKAFVKQFSLNLRSDLLGTRVRVTNVEPGLAETEFSIVRFKGDAARAAKVYENTEPMKAEDIADIIHWVTTVPRHVNINRVEIMATYQAWGPYAIHREG
jgi:NADP-dependent 3-hydroxy acid dehydrogenase YdfG